MIDLNLIHIAHSLFTTFPGTPVALLKNRLNPHAITKNLV